MRARLHATGRHDYDEQIAAVRHLVEKTADGAAPAEDVAQKVLHAMTDATPKTRYLGGAQAHSVAAVARLLPDHMKDWVVRHEADLPPPD